MRRSFVKPPVPRKPESTTACAVCQRDPSRTNSHMAECSHLDCPHRGRAWSEQPHPVRRSGVPEEAE